MLMPKCINVIKVLYRQWVHPTVAYVMKHVMMWSAYLSSVGQEQGRGQVSGDATEDVNNGDANPTCQLLKISQYGHLEDHRHQAVKEPSNTQTQTFLYAVYRSGPLRWNLAHNISNYQKQIFLQRMFKSSVLHHTLHGGRERATNGRTDQAHQGWGRAVSRTHHPDNEPVWQ